MHCIVILCIIGLCTLLQEPEHADNRFFYSSYSGIDISISTSSFTSTVAAAHTNNAG